MSKTTVKSVITKPAKSASKPKKSEKKKSTKSKMVDLENLSSKDLELLRKKLGINPTHVSVNDEEDEEYRRDFHSQARPNIHVEMNTNDISDNEIENFPLRNNFSENLQNELFGEEMSDDDDDDEWLLPKLKAVEKDKPIAKSLASLINTACTNQCATEELLHSLLLSG